jgi:hypothetical protein
MKYKLVALSLFISGAGSKLLQSQLGNSKEIMQLPSYPLLYFYSHWEEWIKRYKNISVNKILNLLLKHHASVINSNKIKGFNGLTNLGKNKNKSIVISKIKFKKYFKEYFKRKKVDSKNTLLAIHYAFNKANNKNFSKIKYILFHVHNYEYFNKYFLEDFPDTKLILITRNPLENFWRKAFTNTSIEKDRYDYSDQEYLKNFSYLNQTRQIFIDVDHINERLSKNTHKRLYKFEDIKIKNEKLIKDIYSFLNIKFNKNHLIPRFFGLEWWSHKNYKGYTNQKGFDPTVNIDPKDKNKFFNYEIFILENLFLKFYKRFNYKLNFSNYNFFSFIILLLLPTKYGFNLFFSRFSIFCFTRYVKNSFMECFNFKLKNYYFNAMYKFKWTYRDKYIINLNYIRKLTYIAKKNQIRYLLGLILFVLKILLYFYMQLELIFLYFYRIFNFIKYYFKINFFKSNLINKIMITKIE